MINHVVIMGRITHDLQLNYISNGFEVLKFNVAVDRMPNKQTGEKQTDFITCVAWKKTALFISKYFAKGRMIALEGTIRSSNFIDKSGIKRYVTEVLVTNVSFTGEHKKQEIDTPYPEQDIMQDNSSNYEYFYGNSNN